MFIFCSALQQLQVSGARQPQQQAQQQQQQQSESADQMEVEETGITSGMIQRMLELSQRYFP